MARQVHYAKSCTYYAETNDACKIVTAAEVTTAVGFAVGTALPCTYGGHLPGAAQIGQTARMGDFTRVLDAINAGDREAIGQEIAMVYPEMRELAHRRLRKYSPNTLPNTCLLYTSDAADEEDSVDLGGRRIIKKKK